MKLKTKEEKLKNIAYELIPIKLRYNLLHLLSDICVNRKDFSIIKENKEIKKYFDKIEDYTVMLYDVLMKDFEGRKEFYKELDNIEKDIEKDYKNIYIYKKAVTNIHENILKENFNRKIKREGYHDEVSLNIEKIEEDCLNYIYNTEFEKSEDIFFDVSKRKSRVLSCLPLRMTKSKYNDCLKKSFKELFLEVRIKNTFIENLTEFYKLSFYPFGYKNYGKGFENIAKKINLLKEKNIEALSDDELEKISKDAEEVSENVDLIMEILKSFYNDINYILNITLFCVDDEYLFDGDIMIKDIYYSVRGIIEDNKDDVFTDEILDRAYDIIESMEDEFDAMDKNFDDILNMIDIEKIPEDVYTCVKAKINIEANYQKELRFIQISDSKDDEEDDDNIEFKNKKIDEILEYIKKTSSEVSNKEAKELKRCFFEYIICCMDDKEYNEYLRFILNSVENMENRNMYLFKLKYEVDNLSFELGDFYDDYDECYHEDNAHCDCGHHH